MIALGFHFRREREREEKARLKKLRKQASVYLPASKLSPLTKDKRCNLKRRGSVPAMVVTTIIGPDEDSSPLDDSCTNHRASSTLPVSRLMSRDDNDGYLSHKNSTPTSTNSNTPDLFSRMQLSNGLAASDRKSSRTPSPRKFSSAEQPRGRSIVAKSRSQACAGKSVDAESFAIANKPSPTASETSPRTAPRIPGAMNKFAAAARKKFSLRSIS